MKATLKRTYHAGNTTGELTLIADDGKELYACKTVELKWLNNQPRMSCIPEGSYQVIIVKDSPKIKYRHFWVMNVPNRDGIKIHRANYSRQLLGCIAPGFNHVDIDKDGLFDVTNSTAALDALLKCCDDNKTTKFTLTITKA